MNVSRAQNGMNRSKWLDAICGNLIKCGNAIKLLIYKLDLNTLNITAKLLNDFFMTVLDNKHELIEACRNRVINRIFHQRIPRRADSVDLLISAIARAKSRRHNQKRCFHMIILLYHKKKSG